ncbi:vicilin-like antimicrobial peptides 2-2 [Tripterygium wilfordii]|uniref:Vicilin-like antimicrobial peptides 2-2 n=1 Tax=Tripterygium wilfordii TaxID=458696 RepID=A0A7J7E1D0_TRIWF|nr:vicilin-like antimicrobial peptides 2-2 [Tripterygium wilfordii]
MMIKTEHALLLLIFSVLLSPLLLLSLAYEVPYPKTEAERCLERCYKAETEFSGLLEYADKCQRKYEGGIKEGRGGEEKQRGNPYYFHAESLQSRFRTQEGHVRVLERFSEKSELLAGIDNFRLAMLEANPNTFVVPHHCKGTISLVRQKKESYNLVRGSVVCVPAGTTVYLVNQDNNEKLNIVKLMQSVNAPGQFKEYFAGGGTNPEPYYTVFSDDILERVLNTPRDELPRLFGQQKKGMIMKATKEQLRGLSRHVSSPGATSHDSNAPFNLLNQRPRYSNEHGQFFEASPEEFKQLQTMDLYVAFSDMDKGSIMAPHYNSRATTVVVVVEGHARIEMGCPHLSQESQGQRREQRTEQEGYYQKISSHLSPGDVFIIPAGHPFTIVASENEKLRTVGFGIHAWNNQRSFLAGRDNIVQQLEKEAKEMSFNVPAEQVEKVFSRQRESFYLGGTQQWQRREEGRGHPLTSIFDFPGFF